MAKSYRMVGVSLRLPDDEDLARLVDAMPHGTVSPWIKRAMRQRAEVEAEGKALKEAR